MMIAADKTNDNTTMASLPSTSSSVNHKEKEIDIWRDSPLRLLGYANEIGESFRHILPRMVMPSYVLAFAYTFGDVGDKGLKTYRADSNQVTKQMLINCFDCLTWQTLASVAIPGYLIN